MYTLGQMYVTDQSRRFILRAPAFDASTHSSSTVAQPVTSRQRKPARFTQPANPPQGTWACTNSLSHMLSTSSCKPLRLSRHVGPALRFYPVKLGS